MLSRSHFGTVHYVHSVLLVMLIVMKLHLKIPLHFQGAHPYASPSVWNFPVLVLI